MKKVVNWFKENYPLALVMLGTCAIMFICLQGAARMKEKSYEISAAFVEHFTNLD